MHARVRSPLHRSPTLRRFAAAALVLALPVFTGCPKDAPDKLEPDVIALVNGEVVRKDAFERDLAREVRTATSEGGPRTPDQVEPFKRALLQTLIERTILLQAARAAQIAADPEEVDRELLRLSSDLPISGLDETLAQNRMSRAELQQNTAAALTIVELFEAQVYSRVAVTEEEIRLEYEKNPAAYLEPEQVRAQQLVVRDLDEARRLLSQVRSGKKFADLARKYSLSADAKVGGDLGYFSRGVMPPQFDEVAFSLRVGQVSDVIATEYGFHIFKLIAKRPARQRELPEVRHEIESRLLREKRVVAQKAFVRGLREKAQVKVNEAALQAVSGL